MQPSINNVDPDQACPRVAELFSLFLRSKVQILLEATMTLKWLLLWEKPSLESHLLVRNKLEDVFLSFHNLAEKQFSILSYYSTVGMS